LGNHGALGNSAYIHGSWSLGMTSVEEALGRTRSLTLPSFAPSAPRAIKAPARAVVAPRVSPTLEHRQLWERRFRMRLRISDTATIVAATGITLLVQVALLGTPVNTVARNGVVLVIAWYVV